MRQRARTDARPLHKYRAKPTVVDGIRFASQKEARRYGELKLLEKAGKIGGLLLQPSFDLCVVETSLMVKLSVTAAHMRGKPCVRPLKKVGTYRADFSYWEPPVSDPGESRQIIEDVKGFRTQLYKWKRKHVEAQYGITVREV